MTPGFLGATLFLFASLAPAATFPTLIQGKTLLEGSPVQVAFTSAARATVIAFISSRCPCSASHEVELKRLWNHYHAQGFTFLGIHSNQDETLTEASTHFREARLPFPILTDTGAKWADTFGALKTPHVYVLSPSGEMLYQGGVDDSHFLNTSKKHYLSDALQAISEGRKPELSVTRTLGCVISRS